MRGAQCKTWFLNVLGSLDGNLHICFPGGRGPVREPGEEVTGLGK